MNDNNNLDANYGAAKSVEKATEFGQIILGLTQKVDAGKISREQAVEKILENTELQLPLDEMYQMCADMLDFFTTENIAALGEKYIAKENYSTLIDIARKTESVDIETNELACDGPISYLYAFSNGAEILEVSSNPETSIVMILSKILSTNGYTIDEKEKSRRLSIQAKRLAEEYGTWSSNPALVNKLKQLCADTTYRTWEAIANELGNDLTALAVRVYASNKNIEKVAKIPLEVRRQISIRNVDSKNVAWQANDGKLDKKLRELVANNPDKEWIEIVEMLKKEDTKITLSSVLNYASKHGIIKPPNRTKAPREKSMWYEDGIKPSKLALRAKELYIQKIYLPRIEGQSTRGKLYEIIDELNAEFPGLNLTHNQISHFTGKLKAELDSQDYSEQ